MLDASQFTFAMANLASSVVAVTTGDSDNRPRGLVATAVFSYSTEPPTVALSVAHTARTHPHLVAASKVAVHVLEGTQQDTASLLASKADDKFTSLEWSWRDGAPVLHGSLVTMLGTIGHCVDYLDHTVLFIHIDDISFGPGSPLIYFQHKMTPLTGDPRTQGCLDHGSSLPSHAPIAAPLTQPRKHK